LAQVFVLTFYTRHLFPKIKYKTNSFFEHTKPTIKLREIKNLKLQIREGKIIK